MIAQARALVFLFSGSFFGFWSLALRVAAIVLINQEMVDFFQEPL